ncbi:hypothetical protein TNCV_2048321 [Trichonephila clavipes]|nr:hypothetical protein TNCV_2048321 [Trichonephila clavipes]
MLVELASSNTTAIGDMLCNSETESSDEENLSWLSFQKLPLQVKGKTLNLDRFKVHRPTQSNESSLAPGLESTTHWPRVLDHKH